MKNQDKIQQMLSSYIDGELPPQQIRQVQDALEQDDRVARQLAQLRMTRRIISQMPKKAAPEDFVARVLASAEREEIVSRDSQAPAEGSLDWTRRLAVAAVLLISLGLGTLAAVALWKPAEGMDLPSDPRVVVGSQDDGRVNIKDAVRVPYAGGNSPIRTSSPVLQVVIQTPDISNTSQDVIKKVLETNQLHPKAQGRSGEGSFWLVEVPEAELQRVKNDLSSLSSSAIVMEDADSEEVVRILASVEPALGPDPRRIRNDTASGDDAPHSRIDEILSQDDDLLHHSGSASPADSGGSGTPDASLRPVTPMIIKVITEKNSPQTQETDE